MFSIESLHFESGRRAGADIWDASPGRDVELNDRRSRSRSPRGQSKPLGAPRGWSAANARQKSNPLGAPLGAPIEAAASDDDDYKNEYVQILLKDFAEECANDRTLLPTLLDDLRKKGIIGRREYLFRDGH